MKVTGVESFILQVPVPRPVTDSVNEAVTIGFGGVRLKTDEGIEGTGYTTTLGHGTEAIKDVIDRYYARLLVGTDPLCHQRAWEQLYWAESHWVGRAGITQMGLAAVDIALWDLKAKAFGVPLWKLVGGHKPGRVASYNTDGGWLNFDIPRLVEETSAIVEQGWRGVKMKVGKPDPRDDLRRVAAVREALGPEIDLMLDANQRWDVTTAVAWAPRFAELDIRWLEEPLDPDDVEGHRRLAESSPIPIALGEHLYSRVAFRDFIERTSIGYVQADVTRLGGVTEWLAVAELALAHHLPLVPHCGDLMRVHQHLGAGHPASPMIECIPWLQQLFEHPADIRAGVFEVGDQPGASTTFEKSAFARYRVA